MRIIDMLESTYPKYDSSDLKMSTARVTITLNRDLLEEAHMVSGGNFSRFVAGLLQERLDALQREQMRAELREGYLTEADVDLAIAREYQFIDREAEQWEER